MPSDEELRRVAEDLRVLGRSLARDLRQAAERARSSGQPPGRAFSAELREMARGTRQRFESPWPVPGLPGPGLAGPGCRHRHHYRRRARYGFYGWCWGWLWRTVRHLFGSPRAGQGNNREPRPAAAVLPPVRRRWDGPVVAAAVALLVAVAWLAGLAGSTPVPAEAVWAVALMVLGASMMLTARTDWSLSRRVWPLVAGAALLLALLASSSTFGLAGTFHRVSFGDVSTAAVDRSTAYGGFGNLTVDARSLAGGTSFSVKSVAGRTVVETPPGVPLAVHLRLFAGQVCVAGRDRADGVDDQVDDLVVPPGSTGGRPLTIDLHQVAGQVLVAGSGCAK